MKTLSQTEFKAEMFTDEHGPLINITQTDGHYEPVEVALHPWQLRAILDHFGVLGTDHQSAKKIATLERHILLLRDRILDLHIRLCNNPADLDWEVNFATATVDIANEFCYDLDHTPTDIVPAIDQKAAP